MRLSYFKAVYLKSIKAIFLHVTSGISVWIKAIEGRTKIAFVNPLNARAVATLGVDNSVMVSVWCFISVKGVVLNGFTC